MNSSKLYSPKYLLMQNNYRKYNIEINKRTIESAKRKKKGLKKLKKLNYKI